MRLLIMKYLFPHALSQLEPSSFFFSLVDADLLCSLLSCAVHHECHWHSDSAFALNKNKTKSGVSKILDKTLGIMI